MQEQVLPIFSKVSRYRAKQFATQGLVEGSSCNGKCQCLDHVLDEAEVSHLVENSGELHKHLLWLNTVAQICDNLIQLILIYFFLWIVKSLDQPSHYITEVLLILGTEHTD